MDTGGAHRRSYGMDDSLAATLADRFRVDAHALRARATVLDTQGKLARNAGPDAAACRHMADACDRVASLFDGATSPDALARLGPSLERLQADERASDARHVYAGAITRLRQALGGEDDADDDDEDDDDDE